MAVNRDLILAGVAGGGTGASLAWFGPKGTVLPTAATGAGSTLDAAFEDAGWISEEGLVKGVDETSNDINAYGSSVPVRTLTTNARITFQISFLESNPTTLSIYNRLPLTGAGSLTVGAGGAISFTEGSARTVEYAAVFDVVDGDNYIRAAVPSLQVTDRTEYTIAAGEAIQYGVTFTAYPGDDGVAVQWYYVLDALA